MVFTSGFAQMNARFLAATRLVLARSGTESTNTTSRVTAKLIKIAFGLTLALGIAFPPLAVTATQNTPSATKVMVYGDSLSAAYNLSASQGWVALMETKLKASNVAVVNASISGETTSGGLSRLRADLNRHHPNIVVLALGANDGLRGLPLSETRKNIISMIDLIQKANARAVLVGIQIPPNYGLDYATDFKNLYLLLAKEKKLPLVPFLLDGIADKLENFQADRLHPTAEAQPRIVQNVLPVVENVVLQLRQKHTHPSPHQHQ